MILFKFMRLYEFFWLINSSKFGRQFWWAKKRVTDLKNSLYYSLKSVGMRLPNTSSFKFPPLFHLDFVKTNYFKKYKILSLSKTSQDLYSQTNQKNNKIFFKKKNIYLFLLIIYWHCFKSMQWKIVKNN